MEAVFINGFPQFYKTTIVVESFNFLGGEVHVKIKENIPHDFPKPKSVTIYARANSSDDIMRILLTNDALKRMGYTSVSLFMPYTPYARQDRVMVEGEPFSLKVFANMINPCGFHKLFVFDAHSDMSGGLIDNINLITNHKFVDYCFNDICSEINYIPLLCSPDGGSYKKIFKLVDAIGYKGEIILCNKARNLETGKIASFTVDKNDLGGKAVIITDDICSKGGTFMGLATELKKRNAGKIYLIVSHYEGSANIIALRESGIERVYTTQSIGKVEDSIGKIENIPFIKEIPFTEFMDFSELKY